MIHAGSVNDVADCVFRDRYISHRSSSLMVPSGRTSAIGLPAARAYRTVAHVPERRPSTWVLGQASSQSQRLAISLFRYSGDITGWTIPPRFAATRARSPEAG